MRPVPARARRGPAGVAAALALLLGACGTGTDEASAPDPAGAATGPTISVDFSGDDTQSATVVPTADHRLIATAVGPSVVAYTEPGGDVPAAELANPIESGAPLTFLVLDEGTGPWIQVLLPVRPNGTVGWVAADDVTLAVTSYRVEIDVSGHQLQVFSQGEAIITSPVAIGTGETPTPIGSFYLIELLKPPDPDGDYGPYAFGLSGFSESLDRFNGGAAVIGIHGTNQPESLGSDVSHGCIRVGNDVITELAQILPLGTPVDIRP
ncbi:MAG: L,D-transpeptidase family protein [Acidimicrobiales bacterium]